VKVYRVVKSTDDRNIWHSELDAFIGEILSETDLDWNSYVCEDEDWLIIKTGDYDPENEWVMPIVIHKSCLEEIKVCTCGKYQVLNNGCICGGY
jgi:hypothetical protein